MPKIHNAKYRIHCAHLTLAIHPKSIWGTKQWLTTYELHVRKDSHSPGLRVNYMHSTLTVVQNNTVSSMWCTKYWGS